MVDCDEQFRLLIANATDFAIFTTDADGRVTVVLGAVDLSGTNTSFAQIAAEAFNVEGAEVKVTTAPTSAAPYAGGSGGSKVTYTVGPAVQKAAEEARRQILDIASHHLEAAAEDLEIIDGMVRKAQQRSFDSSWIRDIWCKIFIGGCP